MKHARTLLIIALLIGCSQLDPRAGRADRGPAPELAEAGRVEIPGAPGPVSPAPAERGIPVLHTRIFVHRADAANTTGFVTRLDDPLIDNDARATVLVTQNWNPGGVGGVYNDHPIGVGFTDVGWVIFNEDGAPIPEGASFNVWIGPGFFHRSEPSNTFASWTEVAHMPGSDDPNAKMFAVHNYGPSGAAGAAHPHPLAAYFNLGGKWSIHNTDGTNMPDRTAFNFTFDSTATIHQATPASIGGNTTAIDDPMTNGRPDALLFVMANATPAGAPVGAAPHNAGVYYDGSRWTVFNQDLAAMAPGAAFNVKAFHPPAITGARMVGRRLVVTGKNFVPGSVVTIDGVVLRTVPDPANPETVLVAKGARRRIPRGATVAVEVVTPELVISRPFDFARPA